MTISLVKARVDAYVREDVVNGNYGDAPRLRLSATSSARFRSFLRPPLPFPIGAIVSLAKLRLFLAAGWTGGPHVITVEVVNQAWRETGPGGVTWNNQPTVTGAAYTASVTAGVDKQLVEIDITALMQAVAAGGPYFGLRVTVNTTGTKSIYSTESGDPDYHPGLQVTWVVPPDAPQDLNPAAGNAVGLAKVVLSWFAPDQVSYQVQIDDTDVFTTPDYDSGMVASVQNQHDMNSFAYSLPLDLLKYWRIRYTDSGGQLSDWSDVASMIRRAKGVLTITSPSGATFDDTSPVITHTFTGTTQESIQYLVEEKNADGTYRQVYDSGRIVTAATSFTIPESAGIVKKLNDYRITVRVWDTYERSATAGDTPYVEAQRVAQYVLNGTPAVPTGVSIIANPTPGPETILEFSRGTRPDFFAILVDGVYYDARVDPATIETTPGGNTYRYKLWKLKPGIQQAVAVEAVILSAGKFINSTPVSVNTTPVVYNKWLVCPDLDLKVCFIGPRADSDPEADIVEDAATHRIPGRRAPVKITNMVMGYAGSVEGGLTYYKGITAATWRDRFEDLLGLAGRYPLRLIWRDMNIGVLIENPRGPKPTRHDWYVAGFDYMQVDSYTFEVKS